MLFRRHVRQPVHRIRQLAALSVTLTALSGTPATGAKTAVLAAAAAERAAPAAPAAPDAPLPRSVAPAVPPPEPAPRSRSWLGRLGDAVLDAATDPEIWVPLAGATVIGATGVDGDLATWAADTAPVFGSSARARDASDALLRGSEWALAAGVVAFSHQDDPLRWAETAGQEAVVAAGATWLTRRTTDRIKRATDRRRPDRTDRLSFPSGHTSSTTVRLTLLRRQARRAGLSPGLTRAVDLGAASAAAACAWARVEGRKHHPSDVLVGYALGRFVGRVLHDAWFGPLGWEGAGVLVGAGGGAVDLRVSARF